MCLKVRLGSPQDLTFLRDPAADHLAQRIATLPAGGVFLDVGANVGYYSILARQVVGNSGLCIACEPSRREFAQLTQHLIANGSTDIVAVNAALGEGPGIAMLRVEAYHTGLNNLIFGTTAADSSTVGEPCLVLTCDDIAAAACPGRMIHLLKVDVEGAELAVLKGADRILTQGLVQVVVVEVTDSFLRRHGHSVDAMYEFMEARCYHGLIGRQDVFQYDEIFVRRPVESPSASGTRCSE